MKKVDANVNAAGKCQINDFESISFYFSLRGRLQDDGHEAGVGLQGF